MSWDTDGIPASPYHPVFTELQAWEVKLNELRRDKARARYRANPWFRTEPAADKPLYGVFICKCCGERMEGDGYSTAYHCPNVELDCQEPDANPIYCTQEV